jgi:hypothetical protein
MESDNVKVIPILPVCPWDKMIAVAVVVQTAPGPLEPKKNGGV